MRRPDRAGIFKARVLRWHVRTSQQSQSLAVSMEFQVAAQLDSTNWVDWSEYEDYCVFGDFWVVGKDGAINTQGVENLVLAIGWDGDLLSVTGAPPDVVVQITVKEEVYNGQTSYKAAWINPEDFTPMPQEASAEEVSQLQRRFGPLLRAAATAMKGTKPGTKPGMKPAAAPASSPTKPLDPQRVEKGPWDTLGGP